MSVRARANVLFQQRQKRDPHRGRREEAVDAVLGDLVEHARRVRRLHQPVLAAEHQPRHQEHMHLRAVIERQRVELPVARREVRCQRRAHVLVDERPVRHDRALRRCGRARRVQELRHVLVVHVRVERGRRRVLCHRQHVLVRRAVAQRAGDLELEPRRADLVRKRGVVEQRAAARLRDQIAQLLAAERVVDRHVDEPGLGRPQPQQRVGVGVPSERCDPVAPGQPQPEQ